MNKQEKIRLGNERAELLRRLAELDYELIKDYVEARKEKGLLPNKLNAVTLAKVIRHFFNNGCGMVSKSFKAIYDENTDPDKREKGMEVDWVEKMANRSYSLEILVHALNELKDFAPLAPLFSAKTFRASNLLNVSSITAGIKLMDTIVAQELEIIRLQELVAALEAEKAATIKARVATDWKAVALDLLAQGKTHKEVAEFVGKSTKTIQRLTKA